MNKVIKWFHAKPIEYQTPSNDDEARLMGCLAVEKFVKEFGPGKKGEGCERYRQFCRTNPGVICHTDLLKQIVVGNRWDQRRREFNELGYMSQSHEDDETLGFHEYRILGYDEKIANSPTLYRCPGDVRAQVWERDAGVCQLCGYVKGEIHPWSGKMERHDIHRIVPGSLYTLEGCLLYCGPCNRGICDTVIPKPEEIELKTAFYRLHKEKRCEILDMLWKEFSCNI